MHDKYLIAGRTCTLQMCECHAILNVYLSFATGNCNFIRLSCNAIWRQDRRPFELPVSILGQANACIFVIDTLNDATVLKDKSMLMTFRLTCNWHRWRLPIIHLMQLHVNAMNAVDYSLKSTSNGIISQTVPMTSFSAKMEANNNINDDGKSSTRFPQWRFCVKSYRQSAALRNTCTDIMRKSTCDKLNNKSAWFFPTVSV